MSKTEFITVLANTLPIIALEEEAEKRRISYIIEDGKITEVLGL